MLLRKSLLALAVAAFALPSVFAEETENPFKNAKVGDYAIYKMEGKVGVGGMNFEMSGTVTQTVIEKDDKKVVLEIETDIPGLPVKPPKQKQEIDLTKPFDPAKMAAGGGGGLPGGAEIKFEKGKSGKEKVKVGGKEYETNWETIIGKAKLPEPIGDMEMNIKTWMSKDVGLGGMVKMEMKSNLMDMVMELKETGSKK
ncbi:MAG: hypothetical protein N2112_01050 [Gemmataceae bacterium]|jgi:hypothetical protein|nr:hypothetical protein [Gemmataceae bacterium]